MAEAVKVIVRCRPMNGREKDLKCKDAVMIDTRIAQCTIKPSDKKAPPKPFTFDGAYGIDSTTEQIYADIGFSLVEGVTEGYNGTIFAYGQTGCGKSFSMQGIPNPATQRGIIPRAFDHIFETIQVSKEVKYLVHAAYLEIYNEDVRDLLGKDIKKKMDLKEHPDRGVYVQGLSMHPCKSVKECSSIMEMGWSNRSTGATAMNADSSRSHSIFTIFMERCDTDENGEEHIRAAKLNLVDLAGSERQGKTGATGDRLKEATKINLSLSALGNVISALVDGRSKHIPYRDSKLTRLLQDSLGGNTKTLMVACLSPADNNYDETLSTLRYANRAKNIKNKPKINEDPKDALLREYQDEITKLKMMLRGEIPVEIGGGGGGAVAVAAHGAKESHRQEHVGIEKERIREEYESEMAAMKQEFEEMKISKEKLEEEMERIHSNYDSQIAGVEGNGHISSPGQKGGEVISIGEEEMDDESEYTGQQKAQRAVHLATVKTLGNEGVPIAPTSSPTNAETEGTMSAQHEEALRSKSVDQDDAFQRLQELQQQMVGGELAEDEEFVKHHTERKKHVEERARRLAEELAKMDGDEIMLDIYEDVHDELKVKNKHIEKEKERNQQMQAEIMDLQSEFEFDRIDYLETIRRQEQQIKWLDSVMDKVHPCLRRDCNYVNLDKIRAQSKWVDEEQKWMMPKMVIEKTKLPSTGIQPGGRQEPVYRQNGDIYDDLRSEDRYLQRLQTQEDDFGKKYFKSKRQDKLLKEDRDRHVPQRVPSPHMNGHTNGFGGQPSTSFGGSPLGNRGPADNMTNDQLRAAQVHGQISQDEFLVRKPTRLGALPQPGTKSKKKKNKMNTMEQY